jgi:hypothetical protein
MDFFSILTADNGPLTIEEENRDITQEQSSVNRWKDLIYGTKRLLP